MIHGLGSLPHCECVGERPAEPGLGALHRRRKVCPESQPRRDRCGQRAAGTVKTTRDELDGAEHANLPVTQKQIAASVSAFEVTALDQNCGRTICYDPLGCSPGVFEAAHRHLGQHRGLLCVRRDERRARDERIFVSPDHIPLGQRNAPTRQPNWVSAMMEPKTRTTSGEPSAPVLAAAGVKSESTVESCARTRSAESSSTWATAWLSCTVISVGTAAPYARCC